MLQHGPPESGTMGFGVSPVTAFRRVPSARHYDSFHCDHSPIAFKILSARRYKLFVVNTIQVWYNTILLWVHSCNYYRLFQIQEVQVWIKT